MSDNKVVVEEEELDVEAPTGDVVVNLEAAEAAAEEEEAIETQLEKEKEDLEAGTTTRFSEASSEQLEIGDDDNDDDEDSFLVGIEEPPTPSTFLTMAPGGVVGEAESFDYDEDNINNEEKYEEKEEEYFNVEIEEPSPQTQQQQQAEEAAEDQIMVGHHHQTVEEGSDNVVKISNNNNSTNDDDERRNDDDDNSFHVGHSTEDVKRGFVALLREFNENKSGWIPWIGQLVASIVLLIAITTLPSSTINKAYGISAAVIAMVFASGGLWLIIAGSFNDRVAESIVMKKYYVLCGCDLLASYLPSGDDDGLSMTPIQIIAYFLFVWWSLAACILTFMGPFLTTSNGYFACWGGAITSFLSLSGSYTNTLKQLREDFMSGLSYMNNALAVVSLILIFATFSNIGSNDKPYHSESLFALIVGMMSLVGILGFTAYEKSTQQQQQHEQQQGIPTTSENDEPLNQLEDEEEVNDDDKEAQQQNDNEDDDVEKQQSDEGVEVSEEQYQEEEDKTQNLRDNDGDNDGSSSSSPNNKMESFQFLFFGIMTILWIVMACLVTFRGPFRLTGNGYFAAWIGCILCCMVTSNYKI